MRVAAARAASRRGSSNKILLLPSHFAERSARGTRVVLPAPGGATRTSAFHSLKCRAISGKSGSIGSEVIARAAHPCVVRVFGRRQDRTCRQGLLRRGSNEPPSPRGRRPG